MRNDEDDSVQALGVVVSGQVLVEIPEEEESEEKPVSAASSSSSETAKSLERIITDNSPPEELIPGILLGLPVKSVIRFTSVCKSWMSTIKCPRFITAHLTLNRNRNAAQLRLFHTISGKEDLFSLYYDTNGIRPHCKIELPVEFNGTKADLRVCGTCNGLVLLDDHYRDRLFLWNVSIRKYVALPSPSIRLSKGSVYHMISALGYDDVSKDYKVVRLATVFEWSGTPVTLTQVYSLTEGCWGLPHSELLKCWIPAVMDPATRVKGVLVKGVLLWLACKWEDEKSRYFVLTCDVASESFGEMKLPEFVESDPDEIVSVTLSYFGDGKSVALFAVHRSEEALDIWVMNEFGAEEKKSWTLVMVLGPQGPERSLHKALCWRRNGEVLLVLKDSSELVSLDIVSKQLRNLGVYCGKVRSVDFFEESLVLLDRDDAISY